MTEQDTKSDLPEGTAGSDLLDDRRNHWGQELCTCLAQFARKADDRKLFSSPESIHRAILQTAFVHLLSCCDLPGDIPVCVELAGSAFDAAVRDMQNQPSVH